MELMCYVHCYESPSWNPVYFLRLQDPFLYYLLIYCRTCWCKATCFYKGKGKGKFAFLNYSPCHEDVWGNRGIVPHIPNSTLYTGWEQSALPPGKSSWYTLDRPNGAQDRFGCCAEEMCRPAHDLATILTELSWLIIQILLLYKL
jgi:hypothetical protein